MNRMDTIPSAPAACGWPRRYYWRYNSPHRKEQS